MNVTAILREAAPFMGAGALAAIVYLLTQRIAFLRGRAGKRVASLTGLEREEAYVAFGSQAHKLRLAFGRFGVQVRPGGEAFVLNTARAAAAAGLFVVLRLLGMPLATSLIGLLAGVILVNGLVAGAWAKVQKDIEREIPMFLTGLSSTVQVTPSVLQAVEDEAHVLQDGSPLQTWLLKEFLPRCQREGQEALAELIPQAFGLSPSLGIVVFLIGRLWQTGGAEWQKAFETATNNIEGVLDARILGQSIGTTAKGSVRLIAAITLFIIFVMVRTEALQRTIQMPLVQIAYALIILAMLYGLQFMDKMIDEAF